MYSKLIFLKGIQNFSKVFLNLLVLLILDQDVVFSVAQEMLR